MGNESRLTTQHVQYEYFRYNACLGAFNRISKKEFERKIKSKYILPVYDSYWDAISENTFYDCRDSIVKIFYLKREKEITIQ